MGYIYLFLLALGVLLSSCSKKDKDIDFYKSQYRDPRILGYWKMLVLDPSEEYIDEYNADGTLIDYSDGRKHFTKYFYTEGNVLMTYENLGWKVKPWKRKYKYEIRNDSLFLQYYDDIYIYFFWL